MIHVFSNASLQCRDSLSSVSFYCSFCAAYCLLPIVYIKILTNIFASNDKNAVTFCKQSVCCGVWHVRNGHRRLFFSTKYSVVLHFFAFSKPASGIFPLRYFLPYRPIFPIRPKSHFRNCRAAIRQTEIILWNCRAAV